MRQILIGVALVALAACNATPTPSSAPAKLQAQAARSATEATDDARLNLSTFVNAALGGEVTLESGLTLNVPPDALSADATVTLSPVRIETLSTGTDLPWAAEPVTLDLGGVVPMRDLEFCLTLNSAFVTASRALSSLAGADPDDLPLVGAVVDGDTVRVVETRYSLASGRACWSVEPSVVTAHLPVGIVAFWNPAGGAMPQPGPRPMPGTNPAPVPQPGPQPTPAPGPQPSPVPAPTPVPAPVPGPIPAPPPPKPPAPSEEGTILQVPFYAQGNTIWSSPTSAAMVYNYHETNLGRTSPWHLAGRRKLANNKNVSLLAVAEGADLPQAAYTHMAWAIKTLDGNAFKNYILATLNGTPKAGERVTPARRPVQVGSDRFLDALVVVGADAKGVWVHDPQWSFKTYDDGRTSDIAARLTWDTFLKAIPKANGFAANVETLVLTLEPRLETQRRGSIVMQQKSATTSDLSFYFWDSITDFVYSKWSWDGSETGQGYYWSDPNEAFPDDKTFGNAFTQKLLSKKNKLYVEAQIANITAKERTYKVRVNLSGPDGAVLESKDFERTVKPYQWNRTDYGVVAIFENVRTKQAGVFTVKLTLMQDDVVQDEKTVSFKVN